MIERLRAQSVSRLVLLVTLVVAVVPVGFLGFHLHDTAWDNAWREVHEKHQLLAQNLAAPIQTYVQDNRDILELMADSVTMLTLSDSQKTRLYLKKSLAKLDGFRSLILLSADGTQLAIAPAADTPNPGARMSGFASESSFLQSKDTHSWSITGVKPHPVTGKPSIFMAQPVLEDGKLKAVLLGELRISVIEQLRQKVRFGKKGHSAIVDQYGHVIAHPNPNWMAQMRDISSWPIVQKMMAGKTGATSFYSPFIEADMVAGYASVPGVGWGIMVPQPKSEVALQVNRLMRSNLIWGVIGVVLALLLGLVISGWITTPLNRLAKAASKLRDNNLQGNLPDVESSSPKEVLQLGSTIKMLVRDLQKSNEQVNELNQGLQEKVDIATRQLRESNALLEQAASMDYVTELANRRHFEKSLSRTLSRRSGDVDNICIMLIDIDHFKQINDHYGHNAGDAVLNHIGRMLERQMRKDDLVARYGGDEFVAHMRCEHEVGLERAAEIRETLENCSITWEGKSIHLTASIGLFSQPLRDDISVSQLLDQADMAMYQAKHGGRNKVVDITSAAAIK